MLSSDESRFGTWIVACFKGIVSVGPVMVLGGICGGRKTLSLLVFNGSSSAQRYINVHTPKVIPFSNETASDHPAR